MNTSQHIAAALTGFLVLTHACATQAADSSPVLTMKPLQGMNFDIGAERAVTYFLSEEGQCKLVVTVAAEPNWDDPSFTATRFETTLDGGEATRFISHQGTAIDFECAPSAQTVSVRPMEQVDAVAVR